MPSSIQIFATETLGFDRAQGLEHLVIDTLFRHQFLMIARLDDVTVLEDYDAVSVSYRR